jgi:hypothetical protein
MVFIYLISLVPLERSFSTTSFLYNKARNRLSLETTNIAIFYYINSHIFERLEKERQVYSNIELVIIDR